MGWTIRLENRSMGQKGAKTINGAAKKEGNGIKKNLALGKERLG